MGFKFTTYNENDWPITVHYEVHGKYRPATMTDPEENADLEIIKVVLFDSHDITADVAESDMDWLTDEMEADFVQQIEDAEAERAEYEYETFRDEQTMRAFA